MDVARRSLQVVTVVGLAVDAYVHFKLAANYDGVKATISQGQLFRLEAVLAVIAAVLLIWRPGRITAGIAALVAGGGTFALLLYYFVNVGQIGPMPNMYEHVFYAEKTITLIAQIIATFTALALVVIGWPAGAKEADRTSAPVAREVPSS